MSTWIADENAGHDFQRNVVAPESEHTHLDKDVDRQNREYPDKIKKEEDSPEDNSKAEEADDTPEPME